MSSRRSGLSYELQWERRSASGTAAEATRGTLAVFVGDVLVWGDAHSGNVHGIPWTWIDLVEHLAKIWVALTVEECDPLGLDVDPAWLWKAARKRWAGMNDPIRIDEEQRALRRFDHDHDLANAMGGADPPSLFLLRQGDTLLIASGRKVMRRPYAEIMNGLETLGNDIAKRIGTLDDERARLARSRWESRSKVEEDRFLVLATSLERESIRAIEARTSLGDPWGLNILASAGLVAQHVLSHQHTSSTPQLCAARMMGATAPAEVVAHVLEWIEASVSRDAPALDAFASHAAREVGPISGTERPAWAQGQRVAQWLRTIPGVVDRQGRAHPEGLLERFGVCIHERDLGWDSIDAVAVWSAKHGPAILVNTGGRHAQGDEGRRATLAHEICHLLVDRHETLPLAEVLGGRAPRSTEARASAFAAELLLPRAIAGDALSTAKSKVEAQKAARKLVGQYGASRQIVAWQAVRSSEHIRPPVLQYLGQLVPEKDRERFHAAISQRSIRR